MFEQFLGALLFLLGFQTAGSVRGESTPSATMTNAATSTESGKKAAALLTAVKMNDITALHAKFQEQQKDSLTLWETKHASFSALLKTIRNEKKITLMETIQNQLFEINKSQTSLFMVKLKYLSAALEQIQKAAEIYAKETGKDPSKVVSAIDTANKAIADAVSVVTVQGEQQYIISITTEATLKTNVETQKTKLTKDLKKVRDLVTNARKKVGDALKALKTFTGATETLKITTEGTN